MSVGKAIYSRLTGTPAVAALVGMRIYPQVAPEKSTYPLVTYDLDETEVNSHYGGKSGLARHTGTVTVVALNYESLETVAAAVKAAIDGQTGTWGGVNVQGCWVEDETDSAETDATRNTVHHVRELDILMWTKT